MFHLPGLSQGRLPPNHQTAGLIFPTLSSLLYGSYLVLLRGGLFFQPVVHLCRGRVQTQFQPALDIINIVKSKENVRNTLR